MLRGNLPPVDLTSYGITDTAEIVHNPSYEQLFHEETLPHLEGYEKGYLTTLGAVSVDTGIYTGRSPKDKYIVDDDTTHDTVWWKGNQKMSTNAWSDLKQQVVEYFNGKRLFVVDAFCGADPDTRISVRFICEIAWQAHFVTNMFIRPTADELATFVPQFTVMNASKISFDKWQQHNLNSSTVIAFNLTENMQLIVKTWYGGEMKKGLFSVAHFHFPRQGILSLHSSANVDSKTGESCFFFGLSGTGKTSLSTDEKRPLIGDDEHLWMSTGIYNLEGGCYAKCINLSQEQEPDIYNAIKRNSLLENVVLEEVDDMDINTNTIASTQRNDQEHKESEHKDNSTNDTSSMKQQQQQQMRLYKPNFNSSAKTENTRVSYPIYHIKNIVKPISKGGHPKRIIFLSADAYGVLPPISLLNEYQAQYYFLSGFTSKMPGTERGVLEATPTFSSCFGAAFLTLHPTLYASLLHQRVQETGARIYLVNTGWNGHGKRISITLTRKMISAIFAGEFDNIDLTNTTTSPPDSSTAAVLPYFNLIFPTHIDGIESSILDPRSSYEDKTVWEQKAQKLSSLFIHNFKQFTDTQHGHDLQQYGPKISE